MIPGTQYIYNLAIKEGLIEIFNDAGCFVGGSSCAFCLGMSCGVIDEGEVSISASNRNFPDRMGKGGMVHLASAATNVMTAINGCITVPSVELCEKVAKRMAYMPVVPFIKLSDWKDREVIPVNYTELYENVKGKGQQKKFGGKAFVLTALDKVTNQFVLAANTDTDQILPAVYLNKVLKTEFGEHCLKGAKMPPEKMKMLAGSNVLVAGENFGCGSSREAAPWALEGVGITCVITSSPARIFHNSMFANGLISAVLSKEELDEIVFGDPVHIDIDWEEGQITCYAKGGQKKNYKFSLSEYQKEQVRVGGLVVVMLKKAAELQRAGLLG